VNLSLWVTHLAAQGYLAEGETPSPRPSINPDDVSPGIESFLIAFILAVALLFLLWSMSRHLRRVQVRAKLEEEARREAEASEKPGSTEDNSGAPDA